MLEAVVLMVYKPLRGILRSVESLHETPSVKAHEIPVEHANDRRADRLRHVQHDRIAELLVRLGVRDDDTRSKLRTATPRSRDQKSIGWISVNVTRQVNTVDYGSRPGNTYEPDRDDSIMPARKNTLATSVPASSRYAAALRS